MAKQDIIKHTSAIHASGSLSLLERKFSNVLLYNAYDDLLTERKHEINIYALSELAGFNSKDIAQAKEVLEKLTKISIKWDVIKADGTNQWGVSNLLSSAVIENGVCTYEYSGSLAEQLANPEIYGRINLQIQKNFTSGYALTIYEICSAFKGILKSKKTAYTKWMELDVFKELLGAKDKKSYDAFKELNRLIIKPSINEINGTQKKYTGTDIFITPEYKKVGKSISDIRFKMSLNPQMALPIEKDKNDELRKTDHYTRLLEYGFSDKGALHLLQSEDESYIAEKLDLVDEAEKQGKIKTSMSGYLKKAIEEDFKPTQKENKAKAEKKRQAEQEQAQQELLDQKKAELEKQASKNIREEYLATLSENEKEQLLAEIKKNIPSPIKKKITDFSSPLVAFELHNHIPNFEDKLLSQLNKI